MSLFSQGLWAVMFILFGIGAILSAYHFAWTDHVFPFVFFPLLAVGLFAARPFVLACAAGGGFQINGETVCLGGFGPNCRRNWWHDGWDRVLIESTNTPPNFRWSERADHVAVSFCASLTARRSASRWAKDRGLISR